MSRKILVLILCLTALSVAARSAEQRPMVGFLPLQGKPGTYTNVIPVLIYWQISLITGVGAIDTGTVADCIQLDRLSLPSSVGDSAGYSRLAGQTGVNYLVLGDIEHVNGSRVRFRLIVCSASNPRFRPEQVYESAASDLPAVAVRAAKWIASEVGAPVGDDIEFDTDQIRPEALRLIDRSARLCTGCEADQSDVNKASDLAKKAKALCPDNGMVSGWERSFTFQRRGYRRLGRGPGAMGRPHGGWRTSDPVLPGPKLSAGGKLIWRFPDAWQTDLENIGPRGIMRGNPRVLKAYIGALIARHPRSAYVRYRCARTLDMLGEGPGMMREYNTALRLNPDSFRLRMSLISAYIHWHKNDKAQAELKTALKLLPNRSECHLLAAEFYRGRKHYDEAAEEMKTVVELDPGTSDNHQKLADDYMRVGKVVESIRENAKFDEGFRRGIVTFSLVLTGVFLLGVLGMVVLVRVVLRA